MAAVGVCLFNNAVVRGLHAVLVGEVILHALNEHFPHGGVVQAVHGSFRPVPAVEIADKGNGLCLGSPYSEICALHAVLHRLMGTEKVKSFAVVSLMEHKQRKFVVFYSIFVVFHLYIKPTFWYKIHMETVCGEFAHISKLSHINILTDCALNYKGYCKSFTNLTYFLQVPCIYSQ